MSTIVTRSGKGSPLTHTEVDDNFTNLNTDKYQEGSAIGSTTPAAGTFTTLTATGQTSLGGAAGSESFRAYVAATSGRRFATQVNTNVYFGVDGTATPLIANTNGGIFSVRTSAIGVTGNEQLRVSNTASAVNYVQVTGAATGGSPTISAQGSDANISLFLNAKGTGNVFLQVGGANVFQAAGSSTSANRILIQANNSGTAPAIQSVGSDTNIDLTLTPKGTGATVANGDFKMNSGYGSAATAYGCRAWVNFNGTGTVAIRASGNVSSITDNGTGDYTVNFTTAMPDVNYCANATGGSTTFDNSFEFVNAVYAYGTSSVRTRNGRYGGGSTDMLHMNISVFR